MQSHKNKKSCVYKKCFSIEDAIHTLECKIQSLIDRDFIPGLSIGIIHDGEIVYTKGFGSRNENDDPFTKDTFVQLEGTTILLLSLYFSLLAEQGKLCPNSRLVNIGYLLPHSHNETMTSNVTDLLSHNLGYNFLDTHLSYLLGHDAETIVKLLECRIFNDNHDVHLERNAFRKFHGKNLHLIERFNQILKVALGSGDIKDEILMFLNSLGIFNFGFGTAEFAAEADRADGVLRKNDSWQSITNIQNVDGFESAMGAFANLDGLLNMIKLIINRGQMNGMQVLDELAIRKYFRERSTRMNLWDIFCDSKNREIPEFHVLGGGAHNVCECDANMSFYSGITDTGLRSAAGWDADQKFGFVVLARGKTSFPEALGFYASQLFNQRDPCKAEECFNWMYRLYNPYIQLHMTGQPCNIPTEDHHRYRRRGVSIPLDGLLMNGCEGQLKLETQDTCLFARFGNIDVPIKLRKVALDNYCFELQDVSGLTHCGQIQFHYNADLSLIRANGTVFNKQSIEYIQDTDNPTFPCDLDCTDLPPLEAGRKKKPKRRKCRPCCRPCYKCKCYPCKCPGRYHGDDDYHKKCHDNPCADNDYSDDSDDYDSDYDKNDCDKYCRKCCYSPCCCPKPICYNLLEENDCFPCRRYRCDECSDEED